MTAPSTLRRAPRDPQRTRLWERGEISEMVVVVVVALFLVVGLVVDGGAKMTAASHAQGLAQGAARAGAQEIGALPTDGKPAQIDPAKAAAAAQDFIGATEEGEGEATIVDGTTLRVTVTVTRPTVFLGLIGVNSVSATRTVEVRLLDGPGDGGGAP